MANIYHATAVRAVNRYPSLVEFSAQKLLGVVARVQNLFFQVLKRYYPYLMAKGAVKEPILVKVVQRVEPQRVAPSIIIHPTAPAAPVQNILDLTKVSTEGRVDEEEVKVPSPLKHSSPDTEIRRTSELVTFDEYKGEPSPSSLTVHPTLEELHSKLEEIEKTHRRGASELEVADLTNLFPDLKEGIEATQPLADKKGALSVILRGLSKIQGENGGSLRGEELDAMVQDGVNNYQKDQFSVDHLDSIFKAYPGLKYAHLSLGSLVEKGESSPRSIEGEAQKVLLKWLKDTLTALSADAPKEGYRVVVLKKTKENPESYGLLIHPKSSKFFASLLQLGEKEILSYQKFEGVEELADRLVKDAGFLSNSSPQEEFQLIRIFNSQESFPT